MIYTPGEGWRYESVGGGKWQRARAKDQLDVAQAAFDKKQYSLALKVKPKDELATSLLAKVQVGGTPTDLRQQ